MESLAQVLAGSPRLHEAVEQLQEDKLLAGAGSVGVVSTALVREVEEVPRFVDGLGAAGQDQRPRVAELAGVGDHLIGTSAVNLHAGDEQQLRRLAIEPRLARADVAVPLALDDAQLREA